MYDIGIRGFSPFDATSREQKSGLRLQAAPFLIRLGSRARGKGITVYTGVQVVDGD
jgi:hypothetical protein